ncbi:hypothetical protein [Fibrobacter sp. UWS1]|uniref:hypothetical protein n=1 Tax=Fibrobacter sp. UWS1 TaxID=1896220 RepID=UPI0013043BC4|nr:hypothetical protein [Fibrobacter sp. UWS1]
MAQKVSKRNDELIRFEISLGADFSFFFRFSPRRLRKSKTAGTRFSCVQTEIQG